MHLPGHDDAQSVCYLDLVKVRCQKRQRTLLKRGCANSVWSSLKYRGLGFPDSS